ncbi:MAG: phosphoglycerate mutase family protein [Gammaproteobacteria bacterium]|nr:phosphoglycerate mutase family protein [Gammaproteobacteria bacterium]
MSTIHLIRHGQASFGTADYDRLSALGERQIQHLRDHYVRSAQAIDAIYSGTLRRQRATAEILAATPQARSEVRSQPAFDEYDADTLLRVHAEISNTPLTALQGAASMPDPRAFQRRLEDTGRAWIAGLLDRPGVETWPQFRQRIAAGLEQLMRDQGRSRQVLVCTSAGAIGAAVGYVLGLDDEAALRLSWSVFNASVTRIRYDGRRCSLEAFNAAPHLETQPDPRPLLTFR